MENEKRLKYDWYLIFIILGAILFYLPFISRNFMGDDWLGLSYGRKAIADPRIIFGRQMYGYFRPLSIVITMAMYKILGLRPVLFGLFNILLHGVNIYLLSEVLRKFNADIKIRYLSLLFFAFYYLNAPVVEWISAGGEIRVACLALLFILQTIHFLERPNFTRFIFVWLLAVSAVLIKETGYVTLGLFVLTAFFFNRPIFSGKAKYYSIFFILSFLGYLIIYAFTRTYVDKQLNLGPSIFINIWYFMVYMYLPIAKRIIQLLPRGLLTLLFFIKILFTVILPIFVYFIFKKGPSVAKFFLLWTIMFVATIAIINWHLNLFTPCPDATATRFFYICNMGGAVVLAWLLVYIYNKIGASFLSRNIIAIATVILIISNFAIAYKTTKIYIDRQKLISNIINDLRPISDSFAENDTLTIIMGKDYISKDIIVESEKHMEAIIYMNFDKNLEVQLDEKRNYADSLIFAEGRNKLIGWDGKTNHLIIPRKKLYDDLSPIEIQ